MLTLLVIVSVCVRVALLILHGEFLLVVDPRPGCRIGDVDMAGAIDDAKRAYNLCQARRLATKAQRVIKAINMAKARKGFKLMEALRGLISNFAMAAFKSMLTCGAVFVMYVADMGTIVVSGHLPNGRPVKIVIRLA